MWELVLLSGTVCGMEFCYAAETAFISPILLGLGLPFVYSALALSLGPALGFFITPVLGSLSDVCTSRYGRRRPFIALLSVGILCGLVLLPTGQQLGIAFGDTHMARNGTLTDGDSGLQPSSSRGIAFTILGFVLLDACCDACQSPSRSYALDVTVEADHARALTAFTIMSGLGGCMGFLVGAVNWEVTAIGDALGGQVPTVFAIVGVFFVVCVTANLVGFKEMPLHIVKQATAAGYFKHQGEYSAIEDCDTGTKPAEVKYTVNQEPKSTESPSPTLKTYLKSIVVMPNSMRTVCLTNLLSCVSLLCHSLFLTEFVGATVFEGDPTAPRNTDLYRLYQEGVRLGCAGLAVAAVSGSAYSVFIERLVRRFGTLVSLAETFLFSFLNAVVTGAFGAFESIAARNTWGGLTAAKFPQGRGRTLNREVYTDRNAIR